MTAVLAIGVWSFLGILVLYKYMVGRNTATSVTSSTTPMRPARPGDKFPWTVDGNAIMLTVPDGAKPGEEHEFSYRRACLQLGPEDGRGVM